MSEGESWPSRDWCGARSLLAQGRQGATECLLPSMNGDRELGGVGCSALCLHRYSKGDVAPQWRDVVPQNGLPGQKEASWQRIAAFFAGEYPCLVFGWCLLSCTGVRENYVAEAEVLLVHCSWWCSLDFLEERCSSDWVEMIQISFGELLFPSCWIPATPISLEAQILASHCSSLFSVLAK